MVPSHTLAMVGRRANPMVRAVARANWSIARRPVPAILTSALAWSLTASVVRASSRANWLVTSNPRPAMLAFANTRAHTLPMVALHTADSFRARWRVALGPSPQRVALASVRRNAFSVLAVNTNWLRAVCTFESGWAFANSWARAFSLATVVQALRHTAIKSRPARQANTHIGAVIASSVAAAKVGANGSRAILASVISDAFASAIDARSTE